MFSIYFNIFFAIFFLFNPIGSKAMVVELGGNFSYSKQVYGDHRENSMVSRKYQASMALYLFQYTGIEFNYGQGKDVVTENNQVVLTEDVNIVSIQNRIYSDTYGVGIRQALSGPKSFLVPLISLGYAKMFKKGESDYTFDSSGNRAVLTKQGSRIRTDSVFAAFALKIRFTQLFYLNGSVRTVFKAFETEKAKDNLTYSAGLSWMF